MDDEGWQQQGSRRKRQGQQRDLTREFENLNINNSGQGTSRGNSTSRRGSSGNRGRSPAGYQGNFGGQHQHYGNARGSHGYRGGQSRDRGGSSRGGGPMSATRNGDIDAQLKPTISKCKLGM
jgi:hypothetical protein